MKISDAGLDIIKHSEGFVGHIYKDIAGLDTVGFGHLLTADDKAAGRFLHGVTLQEATDLLRVDVGSAERAVDGLVKVPLNQHQYDALVDFVFNLGRAALAGSSLLKLLNAGNYAAVPGQLLLWNKARDPKTGKLVPSSGLTLRRQREAQLWSQPM